jgi:hypothetical protein
VPHANSNHHPHRRCRRDVVCLLELNRADGVRRQPEMQGGATTASADRHAAAHHDFANRAESMRTSHRRDHCRSFFASNNNRSSTMPIVRVSAIAIAAAALAGCGASNQRTTTVESSGDVTPTTSAVTPANNRTLPAGARLSATLDQTLGTKVSKAGDTFTATVATALHASDGSVVVPSGAKIEGRVTALDDSDNATEPALIRLAFDRIRINGTSHPFSATIVTANPVQTGSQSTAERNRQIIIGGAVGAAIGALMGEK